jgi:hypothetical protein
MTLMVVLIMMFFNDDSYSIYEQFYSTIDNVHTHAEEKRKKTTNKQTTITSPSKESTKCYVEYPSFLYSFRNSEILF